MSRRLISLLVPIALLLLAPTLSAQATAADGPRIDVARAGIVSPIAMTSLALTVPGPQPAAFKKRGVPQMIIGGAAIIGGAIIGDDVGTIVSLAGLGYGLYGLYLYLN